MLGNLWHMNDAKRRLHAPLDGKIPCEFYFDDLHALKNSAGINCKISAQETGNSVQSNGAACS